jgi:hypothetical protein
VTDAATPRNNIREHRAPDVGFRPQPASTRVMFNAPDSMFDQNLQKMKSLLFDCELMEEDDFI